MALKYSFKKQIFKICLFIPISYAFSSLVISPVGFAYQYHASELTQDNDASSFSLSILHQGMVSHLKLSLEYGSNDGSPAIDHDVLMRDAAALLMSYPEEYDYWEIVNLSITQTLLSKHSQLEYITLKLEILPREFVPYRCISTVTRWAQGSVEEGWEFEVHDIPGHGNTLNASVSYTYKDSIVYPDFLDIRAQLTNYLNSPLGTNLSFEQLEEVLTQHLLNNNSEEISGITIKLW
jgi:hypothetical protein